MGRLFLLDLLFPKVCRSCGDSFRLGLSNILCQSCFDSIEPYGGPRCGHCGLPLPERAFEDAVRARCADCGEKEYFLDQTLAFGAYGGALRLAHHAFKFEGMESLGKILAEKMSGEIPSSFWEGVEGVVPVPLSSERERERGYHPARILAKEVAKVADKPLGDWLRKIRSTPAQMSLNRQARLINPKGAYRYVGPHPAPSQVVLVDDVLTTGATLEECAKILRKAGAARVKAVVFGRTPRDFQEGPV